MISENFLYEDLANKPNLSPEDISIVLEIFFKLGAHERQIFKLLYSGHETMEIAAIYNVSKSTARKWINEVFANIERLSCEPKPASLQLIEERIIYHKREEILSITGTISFESAESNSSKNLLIKIIKKSGKIKINDNFNRLKKLPRWHLSIEGLPEEIEASPQNAKKIIIKLLEMGYEEAFPLIKKFGLKIDQDIIRVSTKPKKS